MRNGCRAETRARRAGPAATVRAIRALAEAGEGNGAELIGRLPWLSELAPAVLLRAATFVFSRRRGCGWSRDGASLSLSERSRLVAEAAYDQLDRYDGDGAGAAAILDLAAGGWRLHRFAGRTGELEAPKTPGALVKPLRQRARLARRAAELRAEGLP